MSDATREQMTFKLAGDYARWVFASILLLNAGAIAAVFNKFPPEQLHRYQWPLALFSLGIVSALFGGFFGWLNLQKAATYFREPGGDGNVAKLAFEEATQRSMWASVIFLFASGGCLLLGAVVLWFRLTSWA